MNPILYEQDAFEANTTTPFTSQGIGVLTDAVSCTVTEELNGAYDLEMTYPVDGRFFKDLTLRRIIKAKPNQTDDPQPFRIYKITKPMSGTVTVYAHHFSYDLSGMVVPPFYVSTPGAVIASITATALPTIQPFVFNNSVTGTKDIRFDRPQSARSILQGFIDTYGGEISYNVANVILAPKRGSDKGAVIAYGKNLMDLRQEENCADVFTGVYPYYKSDEVFISLPEKVVYAQGTFDFEKIMPLDLTENFTEAQPTEAQLRAAANQYITDNKIGVPQVSLDISYVSIEDSEEAIPLHMFEGISLGDDVTVRFEKLNIEEKSRCVKYVYDAVVEHVESITIGDKPVTFMDTASKQYAAMQKGEYQSLITDALVRATQLITNGLGGYVIIHKSDPALTHPDEILILGDSPDIEQATQVWRWNREGLAYSDHGYAPQDPYTYKTAMTANGEIVADMITTGILNAIEITNGNGTFHVTPDGVMTATSGTIGGFTIGADSITSSAVELHNTNGLRFMNNGSVYGRIRRTTSGNDTFLSIILQESGMSFSINVEKSNGQLDPVFMYDRQTDEFHFYRNVYMHGQKVYNVDTVEPKTPGFDRSFLFTKIYANNNGNGTCTFTTDEYLAEFNSCGQYVGCYKVRTHSFTLQNWRVI